ncbi:hypothetical protein Q9Z20_000099 [Staphylococcus pseudintermedius]|nr:hypothetical protein [Staphylococcus pseudintermedius]
MAKVILKIDGKNKTFVKDKLNLGAIKAQAEFEKQLQTGFGALGELQNLYRKHRTILTKIEKVENKLAESDSEEEIESLYSQLDDLEETDEYNAFLKKSEELSNQVEDEQYEDDFDMHDAFADLLVKVFDHQFTVDQVFDGLEIENTLADTYAKIFAGNDAGKPKRKATTTKRQTKS